MRLDKYLSDMKVDTRSNLKKSIRKGAVTIDGALCRDPGAKVSGTEVITYEGTVISFEEYQYFLLNKPKGVVSATEDKFQKTVLDLLPENRRKDLFPVGRLDKDTTGLLLITNDGALSHRLLAPGKHVDKVYEALIRGNVEQKHILAFEEGLQVEEDWKALPAKLELLDLWNLMQEDVSDLDRSKQRVTLKEWFDSDLNLQDKSGLYSYIRITIHEGKYHQIKRMFEAIGMEVLELKRISMGSLTLPSDLAIGEYQKIAMEDIE